MKLNNLLGKRFGRLEVLRYAGLKLKGCKNRSYWACRCDCGNEKEILGQSLYSNHVNSCGCLHRELTAERGRNNHIEYGESSFNSLYKQYFDNAIKREKEFYLTKDEFREIVSQDCYYCVNKPNKARKLRSMYGLFYHNGIDRVDNNKGYTKDNVVPCCTTCNKAKLQMSKEEFLSWIGRVYERCCKT